MNNNTKTQKSIKWRYRLSVQHYLRFVTRLSDMSLAEIYKRLILRIRSTSNYRADYLKNYIEQSEYFGKQLVIGLCPDPIEKLAKQFNDKFFFGPADKSIMVSALKNYCQTDIKYTMNLAEEMYHSGLSLLGQQVQPLASNFDWQADPKSGKQAWPEGWFDEAAAITVENADVKYVWEANRHQFLPMLGRAYWITGDEKHAEKIVDVIDRWILANPAGQGVNWCSHLEVSMRVTSWIWVMPMLLAWKNIEQDFLKRWLFSIGQHYYHLKENLSEFTDPTNHLIGEATGLYILCCCFPQLTNAQSELVRARKVLEKELVEQNTQDGVNKEQASSYHRFVLDFYIQILLLARKQNEPLTDASEVQIRAMCEFQSALAGRSGEAPMFGDSDDARGIPFPENFGWNFRDMSVTGAVLFKLPLQRKSYNSDIPSTVLWLLGIEAAKYYPELNTTDVCEGNKLFRDGGYCFFYNGGHYGQAELIFDTGSLGLWPNASHGHADALSIIVRLDGRILLGDPGTGTYFGPEKIRNKFRKTSSHNTVMVDQLDQADIYGTFKWVNPFSTALEASEEDKYFSYARASHNGYRRLRNPVTHTRSILSIHSMGWLIMDYLEGSGDHTFDWNFHFPPGSVVTRSSSNSFYVKDPVTESGLVLTFLNSVSVNKTLVDFDQNGLWSTGYGEWKASPKITIQKKESTPTFLLTLITPVKLHQSITMESSDTVQASRIGSKACYYAFIDTEGNDTLILENPENERITLPEDIITDADILFLQKNSSGSIKKACVVGDECFLDAGVIGLKCTKNTNMASYINQTTE